MFGWQTFGWQTFGWQTFGWQTFGWQTFGWQTFGQIDVLLRDNLVICLKIIWLTQCLDDTAMNLKLG